MTNSKTTCNIEDKFSNAKLIHPFNLETTHPVALHAYEFDRFETNENRLYVYDKNNILFGLKLEVKFEKDINVYVTPPKDFKCSHYNGNKISRVGITTSNKNTHLSYHGKKKKNKVSGEIHVSSNNKRIGAESQNYIEAPRLSEKQINVYPLPICKLYFKSKSNFITISKPVYNYIQLQDIPYPINTLDIYLSKRGCLNRMLRSDNELDYILSWLLFSSSLNMFAEGQLGWSYEIDDRHSDFIRLYRLPCHDFELLVIISDDKRAIVNNTLEDSLVYFKTKNYLEKILDRYIVKQKGNTYLGVGKGPTPLEKKDWPKLKDLLKK